METENKKPKKVNWWVVYWVFFGILLIFACVNARADEIETTAESTTVDPALEENPVYDFLNEREHTFSDIIVDERVYNSFKTTVKAVNGVDLPEFENVNDFAKRMYAYVLGRYVDVSETTWYTLVEAFSDPAGTLADLGEYIFYDLGLGEWVFDDGIEDYVKSGVDHHIRVRTPSRIGNWYPVPFDSGNVRCTSVSSDVYFTVATYSNSTRTIFAIRGSNTASVTFSYIASGATIGTYAIDTAYTGTEYSGYYKEAVGNAAAQNATKAEYADLFGSAVGYDSVSLALSDFFGDAEEQGGYEIQGAHIIDDNFSVSPLSVFPSVGYPFEDEIINNYNYDNDVTWDNDVVNYYPTSYNYELPYWFVTPSKSYPVEPDYLDDVAVDVPNMPQGSFIQTIYEDYLPSGIVLMITASLSIGILFRVIS